MKTKRFFAVLLCIILMFAVNLTVSAENRATISLSNKTAVPGDSVTIAVDIQNNPGIMAMSFCITYDSSAFEYLGYENGYISSNVNDHPDKGHITVTNVANKNNNTDGTIISVNFKVKDTASPKKHKITIANINRDKFGENLTGCFSQFGETTVMPDVSAGSVTVGATCTNSPHFYSAWSIDIKPTCNGKGTKSRVCARCGHIEEQDIDPAHEFETEWTVDRVATPEQDGIMSRHCKYCDAVTDKLTFKYTEITPTPPADDNDSSNTSNNGSEDNSSDNSNNNSSNNSTDNSSGNNSSGSSQSNQTQKPIIDNTEGAKVPIKEVEKLEDYKNTLNESENTAVKPSGNVGNIDSDNAVTDTETDDTSVPESNTAGKENTENVSDAYAIWFGLPEGLRNFVTKWLLPLVLAIFIIL